MDTSLIEYPSAWLLAIYFVMPRMLAFFSVLPMFNRQAIPGILRAGVAFSFSLLIVPTIVDKTMVVTHYASIMLAVLIKESVIGFVMGFLIALPLWALDIMGAYVDNQRGASIAASINPLTGHDTSPLGELFSQAGLVFLLMSGGLILILDALYTSYMVWPIFQMLPTIDEQMPLVLLSQMDNLMHMAVLLSAPVIFSMFLAEVGLGIVSRFVPQLQVFFMAMPIKSGIAMFVFSIYTMTLFLYFQENIDGIGIKSIVIIKSMFRSE